MKGKIKQLREKYLDKFFVHQNTAGSMIVCHVVRIYYSGSSYLVHVKELYMSFEFNQRKVGSSECIYHLDSFVLKYRTLREREYANRMIEQANKDVDYFLNMETSYRH